MTEPQLDPLRRAQGALLGLAAGDAVGTTVEFKPRGTFPPVMEMTGGGPFQLPPGAWTDDTSMALCLADSLVACAGFDARDQMDRYVRWWRRGERSSTGACFDIGNTTRAALARYLDSGEPFSGATDPYAAGNGSIMRLAPVPICFHSDHTAAVFYSAESSRTTHAAAECVEACRLFGSMLWRALHGASKAEILASDQSLDGLSARIQAIAQGSYADKTAREIRGSGYVVESLEAALWSFARSDSFEAAILTAVNLGDDADTTAAVCGQLAGAFYGDVGIPAAWRKQLHLGGQIADLAVQLWSLGDSLSR